MRDEASIHIVGKPFKIVKDEEFVKIGFKIPMSMNNFKPSLRAIAPKGDINYLVRVPNSVYDAYLKRNLITDDSVYNIRGQVKVSNDNKKNYVDVLCADFTLKGVEPPKQSGGNGEDRKIQKKLETKQWFDDEEVIYIPTAKILLTEKVHFRTKVLGMYGLNAANKSRKINAPLAVRGLENGLYSLVAGLQRYTYAKVLDFEEVPVVIRNMSHEEFIKKYNIIERL